MGKQTLYEAGPETADSVMQLNVDTQLDFEVPVSYNIEEEKTVF